MPVGFSWRVAGSLGGLAAILLGACGGDFPPPPAQIPSCKLNPTPCSILGSDPLCDVAGCHTVYTCTGKASCATAPNATTSACDNPATGCAWTSAGCTGTPLACSNALYAQRTSDCANVGCTQTLECAGGNITYDCSLQTTKTECDEYFLFCAWR